jgi:P4 family phage/plasmid primase-like protien
MEFKPTDFTHVAQARRLAEYANGSISYNQGMGWLVFNGRKFEQSPLKAQLTVQMFTDLQLTEAERYFIEASEKVAVLKVKNPKSTNEKAAAELEEAEAYLKFSRQMRSDGAIKATLHQLESIVYQPVEAFDGETYAINTPEGIINLETGEIDPHDPHRLCTKITAVSPNSENVDIWHEHLSKVMGGNQRVVEYLQEVAGTGLIGEVSREGVEFFYGQGANGKTTTMKAISGSFGDYCVTASSDLLIDVMRSTEAEKELLRGARLAIMEEVDDRAGVSEKKLKEISSRGEIPVNPKHRKPYTFLPQHTLIVCVNSRPTIKSRNRGTWRRVRLTPFEETIQGNDDIPEYDKVLVEKCGGAILQWAIDGAKRFLANKKKIVLPPEISTATEEYRSNSDWLSAFIEDCCDVGKELSEGANELFQAYTAFCRVQGEKPESRQTFSQELIATGYARIGNSKKYRYSGLKLDKTSPATKEFFCEVF